MILPPHGGDSSLAGHFAPAFTHAIASPTARSPDAFDTVNAFGADAAR